LETGIYSPRVTAKNIGNSRFIYNSN
jgi:hypothetical protein